jgi:dTDP-4-amino-4,6-dideoxygalactose transaminase
MDSQLKMKNGVAPAEKRSHVPMLDLKAQYLPLKEEIKESIKEIIESGRFVLGNNVSSLEKEVAAYHGVGHAVGLASGTDSLHLCLKALGIGEGDEVITTPFTFIATAEAITYVGAVPVFVDIEADTLNIDPLKIEEKITKKTRAIMVVHLFGQPARMDDIMSVARKYNLLVIEDCAQSFGASYKGAHTGGIGHAGCFSFYPSKNLGAYGDGGMIVTDDTELIEKVRLYRNHGTVGPYQHAFIGYNSRLDEIQAAVLRVKLKHIDRYNDLRRDIAAIYTSRLHGLVRCPVETGYGRHVYHQYTLRTDRREQVIAALTENNISCVIYYPIPIHLQKAFAYLGYREGDFPESEAAAKEVLSIPVYPELPHETAHEVADVIIAALEG